MAKTFLYTFTGDVETVFPTLRAVDGSTLVCQPGAKVTLAAPTDHPLLTPADVAAPTVSSAPTEPTAGV